MAARTSPKKSAYPGVSMMLSLMSPSVHGARASDSDMWRFTSSGSKSLTVDPSSTFPCRVMAPGGEEQGLRQGGLARAVVSDQGDVADAGRWVARHPAHLPPSRSDRRGRCEGQPTGARSAQPGRPRPVPGAVRAGQKECDGADGTIWRRKAPAEEPRMFDGRWRNAVDRTTKPVGSTSRTDRHHCRCAHHLRPRYVGGHRLRGRIRTPRLRASPCCSPTGLPDLFDGPVAKAVGPSLGAGGLLRLGRRPDRPTGFSSAGWRGIWRPTTTARWCCFRSPSWP